MKIDGMKIDSRREILSLTGVRGVAAFIVMLYHFGEPYNTLGIRTHFHVPRGYLSVDVFYILSGFILAVTYAATFENSVTLSRYRDFAVRRIARIYPAYICIMGIYILKMLINFAGDNPLSQYTPLAMLGNLLMMTGWGLGLLTVIDDAWSVSAEVACYIIFPLLISITVLGPVWLAVVTSGVAGVMVVAVAHSGLGVKGALDVVDADSILPLCRAMAGFTIGLATCRVWRHPTARIMGSSGGTLVAIAALLVTLVFAGSDLAVYVVLPLLILSLADDSPLARALFANPVAMFLGNISYSLYLIHDIFVPPSVRITRKLLDRTGTDEWYLVATCIGMIAACLVSAVLYWKVELPGKRLVMRLLARPRRRQPA